MKATTYINHTRLNHVFEMMNECDKQMSFSKKEAIGYSEISCNALFEHYTLRYNRYKNIRTRLEMWYNDILFRMYRGIVFAPNAKPIASGNDIAALLETVAAEKQLAIIN